MPPSSAAERELFESRLRMWRWIRIPITGLLLWVTLRYLAFGDDWTLIDYTSLALHEGGHMMFSWGSETLHVLGGTLGQLLFPSLFTAYFLKRGDHFAALACGWWLMSNLLNIARYIGDAITQQLPLVGGEIHDWSFLLKEWSLLHQTSEIAWWVRTVGSWGMIILLFAMAWQAYFPSERAIQRNLMGSLEY